MATALHMLILSAGIAVAPALAQESGPAITGVDFVANGPSPLETFRFPSTLAVDAERGMLVVGDTGNSSVVLFDTDGRYRGSIVYEIDDARGIQGSPLAIALDPRGRLLVVDSTRPQVEIMSSRGTRLGFLPDHIASDNLTSRPQDIAVGSDGTIYLLFSGDRPGFLILEPTGALRAKVGFEAPENNDLFGPAGIAVNAAQDRIAVISPQARRAVRLYDRSGRFLREFGKQGEGRNTVSIPVSATWGPGNTLWIVDTVRHVITVFDDLGNHLGFVGGHGFAPGQMYYPVDCAFVDGGRLAVLERAGARLQLLTVQVPSAWSAEGARGHSLGSGTSGAVSLTIEEHQP